MKNQVKIQGLNIELKRLKESQRKKQKRKWQRQLQNAKSTKDEQQKEIDLKVMQLKNKVI